MKRVYEDATYQDRFIRLPELRSIVGCSRDTIFRSIKSGSFPAPTRLGARAIGWLESEIRDWMAKAKETRVTA